MEIERQRGISVATSVLAFEYNGIKINILDTPGHKDFAEDTFRTLTAVDSVIVVVDVAKGVEEQTEKLVAVCRMRNIPIIVLAAGKSARLGQLKQLVIMPNNGTKQLNLLQYTLKLALSFSNNVACILGYQYQKIEATISKLPIEIINI